MDKKKFPVWHLRYALTAWTERPAFFFALLIGYAPAFPPEFPPIPIFSPRRYAPVVSGGVWEERKNEPRLNSDLRGPGGGEMRIGLRNSPNLSKTDFW